MKKFLALFLASAISVMAAPTQPSTPILNGKLLSPLDANGFIIQNLDISNLNIGGGGGGGTPLTDLTLNVPITLFSSSAVNFTIVGGSVSGTMSLHTQPAGTVLSNLSGSTAAPVWNDLATLKSAAGINLVDNTSDVNKPISTAMQVALDLKEAISGHNADITTVNAAIALKASTTDMNAALSLKADVSGLTAAFNGKQDLLPTTSNDGWILARHSGGPQAFFFVDPVSLGGGGGGGGGSGTVTNFSIVNNATELFSASVLNSTVTPQLTLATTTTTPANTFYGNSTNFVGAAQFMGAFGARNILTGGAAVGANLMLMPDPGAIRYIKINANSSITLDSAAQYLTDIGAEAALGNPASNGQVLSSTTLGARSFVSKENPLTFPSPFSRTGDAVSLPLATSASSGYLSSSDWTAFNGKENVLSVAAPLTRTSNTLSIPASSASVSGYLLPADWATFNNKAPSTRTISTTAPITGGGDLSSNRILAIAASTNSVDGYLTGADHTSFASKAPGDSEVAFTNAGTSGTPLSWTSGATVAKESATLTATRFSILPPANAYQPGRIITYYDDKTTGNFARQFRPQGSTDTLNGLNAGAWGANWLAPFIAGASGTYPKAISFKTDGTGAWVTLSSGTADHVEDGVDATKSFGFGASLQTSGVRGLVTAAAGNSFTILPTDSLIAGVVKDIGIGGIPVKQVQKTSEVATVVDTIGTLPTLIIPDNPRIINSLTPPIDLVQILGKVPASFVIQWPPASDYIAGASVRLEDVSGTVSSTFPITVIPRNGTDTFSGGSSSFTFDESYGRRVLTSNGVDSWALPTNKTSIQPFIVLNGPNPTINGGNTAVKLNAHIALAVGANNLAVNNFYDGMDMELVLAQPSTGAGASLNLPSVSRVGPSGAGVVTLSTANNAVDKIHGVYDGTLGAFLWDAPVLAYTPAALPAQPTGLTATPINANRIDLAWTDAATNETSYTVRRAPGATGTAFSDLATGLPVNSNSYSDTSVAGGTGYNYKVTACNSNDCGVPSVAAGTTTSAGGPTADIYEIHLNEGASNATATALTTTTPIGGGATASVGNWLVPGQGGVSGTAAYAPVLGLPNTTGQAISVQGTGTAGTINRKYQVWAFRSGGTHNTVVQVNTTVDGTANGTGNSWTSLDSTHFDRVTWSAVSGASYYEVWRYAVSSGGTPSTTGRISVPSDITGTSTLTFDDTGRAVNLAAPFPGAASNDANTVTANAPVSYFTTGTSTPANIISVSFWIKTSFSSSTSIFLQGSAGSNNWSIQDNPAPSNKLQVQFSRATGNRVGTVSHTPIANNAWHHVVAIMDNSPATNQTTDIKVYFDNVAQTVSYPTQTSSGAKTFNSGTPVIGNNFFAGDVDDFRIFGHALTAGVGSEIEGLFNGNAQ